MRGMLWRVLCYGVLWTFAFVSALHESDAGVVDWHRSFIGVPVAHTLSLAPTFHRLRTAVGASTRSVIVSATSENVLGAYDAVTGDITWRYAFEPEDRIASFRVQRDYIASLSGPGGSTFRSFDVASGDLLSERRLHSPRNGQLFEPTDIGVHLAFVDRGSTEISSSDVLALTNGRTVRRIDVASGKVKWEWSSEDKSSAIVYSRIARTPSTVFVVGLTKSVSSYSLHVAALSAETGEELNTVHIPSHIHNGLTDFLVLSDETSEDPFVVWIEHGPSQLRFASLTPELKGQEKTLRGATFKSVINVGLNERGYFVALRGDGSGMVLRLDRASKGIRDVWEFSESATSERYSESIYSGGLDKESRVYIGRIFWSHVFKTYSAHVFAPHLAEGKGVVRGYTFPFSPDSHGAILHATLDAANPNEMVIHSRFVVVTSTGAVQLWQLDRNQWTREESLAEIELAEFVELPEAKTISTRVGDDDESFVERVSRQVSDAKDFPSYLLAFIRRFATGSYAGASTPASLSKNTVNGTILTRDAFGFRKLIVAATRRDTIFGIDSATGEVVWSRRLGLGWAAKVGGHHVPVKLFVTRTVNDGDSPQVAIITQRIADNGLVDTVLFHVDALTGEDAEGKSPSKGLLEGMDIINGDLVDAFMLQDNEKIIVLVDKFLQIYLFPGTDDKRDVFQSLASRLYFPLPASWKIVGHQVSSEPAFTGKFTAYPIWTSLFAPGETIVSTFRRPAGEVVASLGKVLGDRSTLYKYLNPHLVGYVTRAEGVEGHPATCGVYLIDGAKGTIIYHSVIPAARGACGVQVAFTENWLVYFYYDDEVVSAAQAKGHRIVSVELYEGSGVNDKTKSSEMSIYNNRSSEVTIYEQTYVFPTAVTAVTTTATKFGIATKDLVVANHRGQVQTFPRRIFDPRRPKRKVTSEEQEEWLIQYDPLIPDDARRVISHNYRVLNTRKILSSPAQLESTSLIFAYGGLDLFASRVAPSHTFDILSENFNKAQLVLTIAALSVAILVTRPIVRNKRLKEQWY